MFRRFLSFMKFWFGPQYTKEEQLEMALYRVRGGMGSTTGRTAVGVTTSVRR